MDTSHQALSLKTGPLRRKRSRLQAKKPFSPRSPVIPRHGALVEKAALQFIETERRFAFLFDFDGTLVDLVPNPDKVDVPPELIDDLLTISDSDCAFALVSGRQIAKLEEFLPDVFLPSLGCHGAELRPHRDAPVRHLATPLPASVREKARQVARRHSCFFEDKEYSLSLHLPFTHRRDNLEAELREALESRRNDCVVVKIGRTYEVSQRGATKGNGIDYLMQLPGFRGRTPVYVGDDVGIDHSLKTVFRMGGALIPVRHEHHNPAGLGSNDNAFTSRDVQEFVSLIAKAVSKIG